MFTHSIRNSLTPPVRLLALLAVASISLLTSPAAAQMGNEMIPDPMSTIEFQRYLDRIGFLDVQRQAARPLHEQYKEDFRQLQETEIAPYKKSLMGMAARLPKRDEIEKLMKGRERIHARVRALDDALFAQLHPLLTEDQAARLPRARMARERARNKTQMMSPMGGGAGIDLSEMILRMDLSASEMDLIDPVLSGYETKLTREVNELHEAAISMMMDLVTALEDAGFSSEDDFMQPEAQRRMMEVMREVWGDIYRKVGEKGADISALNRKTLTSLSAVMPKVDARVLLRRYFSRAYSQWQGDIPAHERGFERMMELEGLTDEQKAQVNAALDAYYASSTTILNDIADTVDDFSKSFSFFDFAEGGWEEIQKELNAKEQKLTDAAEATQQRIEQIAGSELWHKAATMRAEEDEQEAPEGVVMITEEQPAGDSGEEVDPDEVQDRYGPGALVPPRISRASLKAYARRLGIAEEEMDVLRQIHEEYREKYKAIRDNEIKKVREGQSSLWSAGQDDDQSPEKVVQSLYANIAAARQAVEDLDEWFFNEVALMLVDETQKDALQRVRLARQRERYASRGTMSMTMGPFGGKEHDIDVAQLVEGLSLSDEQWKSVDAVLAAYEAEVTDVARERFDVIVNAEKAMQTMQLRQMRSRGEGEEGWSVDVAMEWQKVWQNNATALKESGDKIAQINRQTLPKVIAALPTSLGRELRKKYDSTAYPQIYNDARSAEGKIDAALNLNDLSDDQRAQLEEIAKEYRTKYHGFCEQMKAANPGQPAFWGGDRDDIEDWSAKMDRMRSLRRDRDEVNANAILNLKAVLSADQQQRIGGVELPAQREREWWEE